MWKLITYIIQTNSLKVWGDNIARNKYPEKTVEKILNVSRELFFEKGYDDTTMQDIISKGLSKGAIYHHFKSKEEIFDRIMQRIEGNSNYDLSNVNDRCKNALEKLKEVLYIQLINEERIKLLPNAVSMFEDPKVFGKLYNMNIKYSTAKIKEFIEQGNKDASMNCIYVEETAELITLFFSIWIGTSLYHVKQDEFKKKVQFYTMLFQQSGVDLIDERLSTALSNYYKKITKVV